MGCVLNIVTLVLMLAGCATCHYQKRVIGKDCLADQGQHHVVLTTPGDKRGFGHCGGSLLSPQWIITATHCDKAKLDVIIGKHPGGTGIRKSITDSDKRKFEDKKANIYHELMLIKIDETDTKTATTIQLPELKSCIAPPLTTNVEIFGWMTATVDPKTQKKNIFHAKNLQCGHIAIVDCPSKDFYAKCSGLAKYQFQHLLCGMDPKGICDGCHGDSGSSLLHGGKLHGVLVMSDDYHCGDTVDFMKICHPEYRKWIFATTGL